MILSRDRTDVGGGGSGAGIRDATDLCMYSAYTHTTEHTHTLYTELLQARSLFSSPCKTCLTSLFATSDIARGNFISEHLNALGITSHLSIFSLSALNCDYLASPGPWIAS